MNDCLNDETLQMLLDSELSAESAAAARSHVTGCPWCAAKASAAHRALSLADDAWEAGLPQAIPSVRLRARLDTASAVSPGWPGFWGRFLRPQLGFAAAAVILAIGLTMVLRNRPTETSPLAPQQVAPPMQQENPKAETPALVAPDPPRSPHQARPLAPAVDRIAAALPKRERRRIAVSETTKHLEQTQQLLRSIRNAEEETADWVYDLQVSRELLNRNRLLRRQAERREDASAERILVHVEPILLDLANLAEEPARDQIDSLKAMIREQSIIAELQLYAARVKS